MTTIDINRENPYKRYVRQAAQPQWREDNEYLVDCGFGKLMEEALASLLKERPPPGDAVSFLAKHFANIAQNQKLLDSEQMAASPEKVIPADLTGGGKIERFACVAVVFEHPAYYLDAAVLGESLKTKTEHEMVLLHCNVPDDWLEVLRQVGWQTRQVKHIKYKKTLIKQGSRFTHVFTKLRALELTEFKKVVLLDSDMICRQSPDELFSRDAPAACRRHAAGKYEDCSEIDGKHFFNKWGWQVGGINAGVVLLEPSKEDSKKIIVELKSGVIQGHVPLLAPDQDYLSRFFIHKWSNLHVKWNYQLHQLSYCGRIGHEDSVRMQLPYEDIKFLHFSSVIKPRHWALDPEMNIMTRANFIEHKLLDQFMRILEEHSPSTREIVKDHIKNVTRRAANEWFEYFDAFLKQNAFFDDMIQQAREGEPMDKPKKSGRGQKRKHWVKRQCHSKKRFCTESGMRPPPMPLGKLIEHMLSPHR